MYFIHSYYVEPLCETDVLTYSTIGEFNTVVASCAVIYMDFNSIQKKWTCQVEYTTNSKIKFLKIKND